MPGMDEHLREKERAAAGGDPQAEERLRHARCRAGECCAHASYPPVPEHAASVVERIRTFGIIPGHTDAYQARVEFRGDADKIHEVLRWLRVCGITPPRPQRTTDLPAEPDGDFCILGYNLYATPMEGSVRPRQAVRGEACATSAFDYVDGLATLRLGPGLWRCALHVQTGGVPGAVRLAWEERLYINAPGRPRHSEMTICTGSPANHAIERTVRVPALGEDEPVVLSMQFRRATAHEIAENFFTSLEEA